MVNILLFYFSAGRQDTLWFIRVSLHSCLQKSCGKELYENKSGSSREHSKNTVARIWRRLQLLRPVCEW